jgi:HD-GYP domain-containing protein (c-di-GMP phosphodiesterase class II)
MHLVDLRMYEQKATGRMSPESQTISALLRALHERDSSLSARLEHAGELAGAVARQLGLSSSEEDRVAQAARIHDVGKVAIPDEVLNKPTPLNPAEWAFVRQCPTVGERIAIAAPALAALAPLIRSTRERFDGTGYPDNLTGEQIPLGSRIIAACSALAAMTASRPYSPARKLSDALLELRECAGTQFDPRIVDAIAEALSAIDARQLTGVPPMKAA